MGRDNCRTSAISASMSFNPRAPCRARLHYRHNTTLLFCFNPRAPCGARHGLTVFVPFPHGVSIHAPHAGRDYTMGSADYIAQCFNPRAPCGARRMQIVYPPRGAMFQSTRPMRGATPTPGTERAWRTVSIHAPHAGRDLSIVPRITGFRFQSTRPMRGATDDAGGAAGR